MKIAHFSVTALITMTMVAALSVTPAYASPDSAEPAAPPSAAAVEQTTLNATEAMASWDALSEAETRASLAANVSALQTESGLRLDQGRADGWVVDRNTTLIRIPVATGQGVVDPSALSLFLGRRGEVTAVVESVFTPTSATSGVVQAWVDGRLQVSQSVGEPLAATSSTVAPTAAFGSPAWWSALNSCLANQGVPAWIVTGLSIICAAACAVTAGLACVLCIAAAAGFSSGVVAACVDYANRA